MRGASFESERRDWAYNRLVKLFPVNLYNSYGNALDAFDYVSDHRSFTATQTAAIKYLGAGIMLAVNNRLKQKYGIQDEEAELKRELETWARWLRESNGVPVTAGAAAAEDGQRGRGDGLAGAEKGARVAGGAKESWAGGGDLDTAENTFVGFHSGGEEPDELDVTVYGMLAAMRDMRAHEAFTVPAVGEWFAEMEKRVGRVN